MVSDLAVCPHALTPWADRGGEIPTTRCARDLPRQMTAEEVAAVLGLSKRHVKWLTARALDSLRKRTDRSWKET